MKICRDALAYLPADPAPCHHGATLAGAHRDPVCLCLPWGVVIPCLMPSVFRTIISCILSLVFFGCSKWDGKFGPWYSILA